MDNNVFVNSIVHDYLDNGYGEKVNDNTIRSFVDETEVSFEPMLNDDESKTIGVNVFTNGVLTVSAKYTEKDFVEKVNNSVLSDLGIL